VSALHQPARERSERGGAGGCTPRRRWGALTHAARRLAFSQPTAYKLGSFATQSDSETGNVFTIPVSGGAGPCPNGAMRSGTLTLTCGAASTTFTVVENPMCTYIMTYSTTQACPSPVPVSYFNNYIVRCALLSLARGERLGCD
jgi:hypothetical protein